ncbi:hypothetical protein [Ruegeria arenilitoris]|uniref:hypothetical protein n=1 Tax=Ruegeria arenilitoris TaxID=1173585 RepID=UPI001479FF3C|nr:hypothetical protein [Ruegeria arenilitoris]
MMLIRTVYTLLSRFISDAAKRSSAGLFGLASMIFVAFTPKPLLADLVSPYGGETAPNFVELSVEADHVRVALEIDLNSYPLFVVADDGSGISLAERTAQNFHVEADGSELPRVVNTIDVRPRVLRQTAASTFVSPRPRSEKVVFVEMEFPFERPPERITFTPPLNNDGIPLASIGVVAEHLGVPVTDYRYLSQAETMLPDWDDPWFTVFENPNLTRHHKSPLMSFLTMEPREVRHEIIFRLQDFEAWSGLDLGGTHRLTREDVASIKSAAAAFFKNKIPVTIDGTLVQPEAVKVSRIKVGAEGLLVLPDEAEAKRKTMLLGVVLSYPNRSLANRVEMTWQLFPEGLDVIPITLTDPAGGVPSQVYRSDPTVVWQNHLTKWEDPKTRPVIVKTAGLPEMPLVAMALGIAAFICAALASQSTAKKRLFLIGVCGAASAAAIVTFPQKQPLPFVPAPTQDEAASHQVMHSFLTNISAAMLEPRDVQFKDALEPFVDVSNRNDVGTEMRRGLSVTLPSGALARVDDISDLQVERFSADTGNNQHQVLANWTAEVSGGHWGHLHRRAVLYRGMFDISRSGDRWKLDGLTIISAKAEG